MNKEIFVFVVCGAKEHINTLHYSLEYLSKYSEKEIYVITEISRNEIEILHSNIIDVKTPENYNNHQASIYLKTSIHRYLPKNNLYCYLDSDVIALSRNCDKIFKEFISPIRFAADHCTLQAFSPYAINCGCVEKNEKDRVTFYKEFEKLDKNKSLQSFSQRLHRAKIQKIYNKIGGSILRKIFVGLKYKLSLKKFNLNENYTLNRKSKAWKTADGITVKYELDYSALEKASEIKLSKWKGEWLNFKNENIFDFSCNHLKQKILEDFDVNITDENFQHWNGGVFLFNDDSRQFLDSWHNKTVKIFNLNDWKTRDQGTLIATVWDFELHNQPTLGKEWNFIADYYNHELFCDIENDKLTDNLFETTFEPNFIHIYHHWEDTNWDVWNWVVNKKKR